MTPTEKLERAKLAIDRQTKHADQELARKQFDLAEKQFEWQKQQSAHSGWGALVSPTGVVLVGAALGLIGTGVGKWADYLTTKRQQETTIILKAGEVPASLSPLQQDQQRARNLLWFAQARYIDLPDKFVKQLEDASNLDGKPLPPPVVQYQTTGSDLDVVKNLEGFQPLPYKDASGKTAIGYSHVLTDDELSSEKIVTDAGPVVFGGGITEEQAELILKKDLAPCYKTIHDSVKVALTSPQTDALAALCFAIGTKNFTNSSLLTHLNDGNYEAVPDDLRRWIKAGEVVSPGLSKRAEAEVFLWRRPSSDGPAKHSGPNAGQPSTPAPASH